MKRTWKYPREAPVLEYGDVVQGRFHDGERSCLLGWLHRTFGTVVPGDKPYNVVRRVALKVAGDAIRTRMDRSTITLPTLNDHRICKQYLHDVWNEAMRKLGYTEISE